MPEEPLDPDVDLRDPAQQRELVRHHVSVLGVIALGGALGALARYGLAQALPAEPGGFPWATFWTNVAGCFLIGVLMVLVTEAWSAHRLVRPFLGVGVLGGFTTFSTYAVEARNLLRPDTVPLAFAYLGGTLAAALLAVLLGHAITRKLVPVEVAV
ncbi:fluoride efflux transporter CrcB [Amycolatopsis echigonensis]|uniref:Fluoride-specific ion channel FluC n=1 Tax=Amycolatopsis echigonensis TaxID=2576905 RepID=A0A8E1W8U3_9PSEU|nr:fluoride efflux transporter CrcB [Amycolatopsis echigonensis]MBB2505737.1 fluoride efflux transporter CrcB [Amycolatopsis echigonensis]